MTPDDAHSGFCSILGLPNVGKSTLLNRILGIRLVAVSPKPQTTRNRILGVLNVDDPPAQVVFVDTPGIQQGTSALRKYMRDQALSAAGDCDVALLVIDISTASQRTPGRLDASEAAALSEALEGVKAPVVLALNKVDRIANKDDLLPIMAAYSDTGRYADVVPISATKGTNVDRLIPLIAKHLPMGPRMFPEEMYTDRAERFLASELVREQLFLQLGDELPYATAVMVESFDERSDKGDVVISAVIYVERDSQKGIVVGKGGKRIKTVGERARNSISELLRCPVHLKLFVKVSANWSRAQQGIRDMGYE